MSGSGGSAAPCSCGRSPATCTSRAPVGNPAGQELSRAPAMSGPSCPPLMAALGTYNGMQLDDYTAGSCCHSLLLKKIGWKSAACNVFLSCPEQYPDLYGFYKVASCCCTICFFAVPNKKNKKHIPQLCSKNGK